jgi:hypothetical protein
MLLTCNRKKLNYKETFCTCKKYCQFPTDEFAANRSDEKIATRPRHLQEMSARIRNCSIFEGAQLLRHYATNRQVAGSIPYGVIGIFQ